MVGDREEDQGDTGLMTLEIGQRILLVCTVVQGIGTFVHGP